MFYHLKIMLRNLKRGGLYSAINIGGLAVSLTAVLLILLWVNDEMSFDKFHQRSKDIFQTNIYIKYNNDSYWWDIACAPLAFAAKEEIPEIENTCRYYAHWGADMLKYTGDDQERVVTGFTYGMVDSTFFSMFDFPVLEGNVQHMLADPQSIVLSESIAKQLFDDETPIGKVLYNNNRQQYYVTGVMADMPQNSSIRFDIIFPFSLYEQSRPDELVGWERFDFKTWFLLRPHTDVAAIGEKITELQHRHARNIDVRYELQSLETVNFHNADGSVNSKAQTCSLFLTVAFVIMLVACVNYVNISTARASFRNKEVFIRNILGARKGHLFFRFLNESILLFMFSLIAATILLYLIFPVFNYIAGKQLDFHIFSINTLVIYGFTFIVVIICAGIYPALNLAIKKPLQGLSNKSGNVVLRRVLVVGQFIVAIVLLAVTITTNMQLEYVKKKNLGYEKENVFHVQMSTNLKNHYEAVKSELLQHSFISEVTATSMPLKNVTSTYGISDIEGSDIEDLKTILLCTDKDFITTMDVNLVAGSNFCGMPVDATSIILNETAVKNMDITDPIGKKCTVRGVRGTIIGVVQDFHFKDLHIPIEPLVILANDWRNALYIRTSANGASQAIAAVEKIWKQYESELPFSYRFIDDEFDSIYKSDIQTGRLFNAFALIAMFISCLGLFGLVTYAAETKAKEIAIRKVLGASVSNLTGMLSREFIILVGIAMLSAFPLAYYWLDKMLQDFAYRINLNWWIFAVAALTTIVLTLFTVSVQAIKAATANPVEAIKSN